MAEEKMSMAAWMEEGERDLLHTYNRYPLVIDHGEGVYLVDLEGKKYLDFMSGIGVFALGYGNEEYNEALKAQIDKIVHTSNMFYNVPAIRAAKRVKEISGMDRVFFTNSGTEAVEGALKAAMKYAWLKDGRNDHEVIAMNHSFHGRTYGALAVTGTEHYRAPFGEMPCDVRFAELNNTQSVLDQVNEKTCAIIFEPIQGEGGIIPATEEFLRDMRALCDERDILLIFDEVQCGMGRSGDMFAWQKYGVRPDLMSSAKALGCGIPVGAFLMTEHVAQNSLTAGDHGSTYGGNPLAGAAVNAVLDQYEKLHLVEHVREVAPYLEERLQELVDRHESVQLRRGRGLIQGLVFDCPVGEVIARARENGLMLINAGAQVIRILPPLVITRENVDEMFAVLDKSISETVG